MLRSNRTIVGLKELPLNVPKPSPVQQSHHCGIERQAIRNRAEIQRAGSNRTIVGLKDGGEGQNAQHSRCSNRTIVGLKGGILLRQCTMLHEQQSHHCGIESGLPESIAPAQSMQQSHHCGIERLADEALQLSARSSNRTIVGLKDACWTDKKCDPVRQQSHHCGIETVATATGDW